MFYVVFYAVTHKALSDHWSPNKTPLKISYVLRYTIFQPLLGISIGTNVYQ